MKFDWVRFERIVKLAYRRIDECRYSLDDVLGVLRYFIETYEEIFDDVHPMLTVSQLEKIIAVMPWIEDNDLPWDTAEFLEPCCYPPMIDDYFATDFRSCDYRLNHFFSGNIRMIRFYQVQGEL